MPAVNITAQQILKIHLTRIYQNKIFNRFLFIFFFHTYFCYFYLRKIKVPLLGMRGQMNPVTTDDRFETLAFGVCNSDGVEGLSWAEVEKCQVINYKYDTQELGYFALSSSSD